MVEYQFSSLVYDVDLAALIDVRRQVDANQFALHVDTSYVIDCTGTSLAQIDAGADDGESISSKVIWRTVSMGDPNALSLMPLFSMTGYQRLVGLDGLSHGKIWSKALLT